MAPTAPQLQTQLPQQHTAASSDGRTVYVTQGQLSRPPPPELRQQVFIDNTGNRFTVAPAGAPAQYTTAPAIYMTAPVPIPASPAQPHLTGQLRPTMATRPAPATPQQSAVAKRPPPPLPPEATMTDTDQLHHNPSDHGPSLSGQGRPSGFVQR